MKAIIIIFVIIVTFLCISINTGLITRPTEAIAQSNDNSIANTTITTTATLTSPLTDKVPSFLEAYWTDNTTTTANNNKLKKEVGPGEGASTLAIVLVNRGRSEITGVTGYLTLPSGGFRSIEGENNVTSPYITVASHESIVEPGGSFILNFPIIVLPEAKVRAYSSSLNIVYSKILEVGQISTSMIVPFRITGKVILDIALLEQNLSAGSANQLPILLSNKGTANATGAIVTINTISGGTVTTTSTTTATTQPNSISSSSLPSTSININSTSTNTTNSDEDTESVMTATTTSSDLEEQEETSVTLIDSKTFDVGTIHAESSVIITPVIYPDYSADGTIQDLDLEISYNDAYGVRTTTDYSIGMIISPNSPESILSISPGITGFGVAEIGTNASGINRMNNSIMLTAGRIEDVGFTITNNGETPLVDFVLSLDSGSDSVKILGDSRWRFEEMAPGSEHILSTILYAAEDVINTPVEFTVDAEYIEEGQLKTDALSIGAYVDGHIKVRAYDLAINSVGNVPTLAGNLLNEGNTLALFTTIELVNSTTAKSNEQGSINSLLTSRPQQQYLGDLLENSPLPFSIPLDIDRDALAGIYPVNLRITYSDNLRNVHELILNGTVEYKPVLPQSTNNTGSQSLNSLITILVAAGVAVAAVVSLIFLFRRRKKKKVVLQQRSIDNLEREQEIDLLSDGPSSDQKNIEE
ncbi:MAG: hypothetical protein ACRD8W_07885 [Nitrososphaeraceae archaeon]